MKTLKAVMLGVLVFIAGTFCVTKVDQGQKWFCDNRDSLSAWWNGPPSDASPLCLQIAQMLEDSNHWQMEDDELIRLVRKDKIVMSVLCQNTREVVIYEDTDKADELLTKTEKKYLVGKFKECRDKITARDRLNMANKLKGKKNESLVGH